MIKYGYSFHTIVTLSTPKQTSKVEDIISKNNKEIDLELSYISGTLTTYRLKANFSRHTTPKRFKQFYRIIKKIMDTGDKYP